MPEINKTALFDIAGILSKMGIEEKQQVAELGCGNFGFFVYPLARLVGRYGKVYAVDILKPVLEEVQKEARKENLPQIKTVWSNLEIFRATDIPVGSLDSALLVNTLHQSSQRAEILREAIRLIRRGGKLLVIEWKNEDIPLGPSPDRRVRLESLKSAAPKIGMAVKEEFAAGPYHYGVILTKL